MVPSTRSRIVPERFLKDGEQVVEGGVALIEAAFHIRLQYAVALLGRVEERDRRDPGATVTKILERHGLHDHLRACHPIQTLHEPLWR